MKEGKVLKHVTKALLICAAMVMMLSFGTLGAKAADNDPRLPVKSTTLWVMKKNPSFSYPIQNMKSGDVLVSVKSSNSKKLTANKAKINGSQCAVLNPKKTGVVKVTATIKRGKKTFKSTMKVTLLKYKNPVASFKIGKREISDNFNDRFDTYNLSLKGKQKVSIVSTSEWEVVKIFTYNKKGKRKFYKNNSKIQLTNVTQLSVSLVNKKDSNLTMFIHVVPKL
jgi:hypothetical protein